MSDKKLIIAASFLVIFLIVVLIISSITVQSIWQSPSEKENILVTNTNTYVFDDTFYDISYSSHTELKKQSNMSYYGVIREDPDHIIERIAPKSDNMIPIEGAIESIKNYVFYTYNTLPVYNSYAYIDYVTPNLDDKDDVVIMCTLEIFLETERSIAVRIMLDSITGEVISFKMLFVSLEFSYSDTSIMVPTYDMPKDAVIITQEDEEKILDNIEYNLETFGYISDINFVEYNYKIHSSYSFEKEIIEYYVLYEAAVYLNDGTYLYFYYTADTENLILLDFSHVDEYRKYDLSPITVSLIW